MSSLPLAQSVAAATVTISFTLVGNAITQSWMTVPALLIGYPQPHDAEHTRRSALLAEQWKLMHHVGNNFFRPISTVAILGYGFASYSAAQGKLQGDWRLFAVAALCHVANVVHSAVNLQPINAKLDALATTEDKWGAVTWAQSWIECNKWRVVFPGGAGSLVLWQAFLLGW